MHPSYTLRCLTPPSRGRPQAGFAHLRPPLTSNVRHQISLLSIEPATLQLKMKQALLISALSVASSAVLADEPCKMEYERGQREMGAWAEMLGLIEGTIYGYSLMHESNSICLIGTPRQRVKAIAEAIQSETNQSSSLDQPSTLLDDVPSERQAIAFLEKHFPCRGVVPNPSVKGTGLRPAPYVER